jgi:hypothetical protein
VSLMAASFADVKQSPIIAPRLIILPIDMEYDYYSFDEFEFA